MGSIGTNQNNGSGSTNQGSVSNTDNEFRTDRNLYSKTQADELTADYTPQMFLGQQKYMDLWDGTGDGLRRLAEQNMPDTLNIGGYAFQNTHNDIFRPILDYEKNKNIVKVEYQSTEQVGNEYPIIQVGIRVWRTKGGKVKSEIIRDGYLNKTRFL